MAAQAVTFESVSRDLRAGRAPQILAIHGAEAYYADALVPLAEALVPADMRDFALTVVYAPQTDAKQVLDMARSVPMMAERQVVIVKEMQSESAAWADKLIPYLQAPSPSTTLVLVSRGAAFKSKAMVKAVTAAGGTVFESQKVGEWQVPKLLTAYIKDRGLTVDAKALDMLRDFIGADLSRLYNEVDKLTQVLGPRAMITPEAVERNVGVSREFNNFELVDALAVKDAARVFRIAAYFEANQKANPLVMTVAALFNFYSDLLIAYYAADKSDRGISKELGLRNDFALRRVRGAMQRYNAFQVIEAIHAIRRFDAMSKGSGSREDPYRLFHDLLYHLLTAPGRLPA